MSEDLALEARRESAKLGLALKQYIRECDSTAAHGSRALGRAPQYLTRVFAGILPLRIEEVFRLFEILGRHPHVFFDRHYPLGGVERDPPAASPGPPPQEAPHLAAYLESAVAAPLPPSAEMEKRAGRILKGLIVGASTRQRAVSLKMGLPRDALGQALRGGTDLSAWHVFGVLAATKTSAAQFFRALLGPDDSLASASAGTPRWDDLVGALERALTGYLELQGPKPAAEPASAKPPSAKPAKAKPDRSRPSRRKAVRRTKTTKPKR